MKTLVIRPTYLNTAPFALINTTMSLQFFYNSATPENPFAIVMVYVVPGVFAGTIADLGEPSLILFNVMNQTVPNTVTSEGDFNISLSTLAGSLVIPTLESVLVDGAFSVVTVLVSYRTPEMAPAGFDGSTSVTLIPTKVSVA